MAQLTVEQKAEQLRLRIENAPQGVDVTLLADILNVYNSIADASNSGNFYAALDAKDDFNARYKNPDLLLPQTTEDVEAIKAVAQFQALSGGVDDLLDAVRPPAPPVEPAPAAQAPADVAGGEGSDIAAAGPGPQSQSPAAQAPADVVGGEGSDIAAAGPGPQSQSPAAQAPADVAGGEGSDIAAAGPGPQSQPPAAQAPADVAGGEGSDIAAAGPGPQSQPPAAQPPADVAGGEGSDIAAAGPGPQSQPSAEPAIAPAEPAMVKKTNRYEVVHNSYSRQSDDYGYSPIMFRQTSDRIFVNVSEGVGGMTEPKNFSIPEEALQEGSFNQYFKENPQEFLKFLKKLRVQSHENIKMAFVAFDLGLQDKEFYSAIKGVESESLDDIKTKLIEVIENELGQEPAPVEPAPQRTGGIGAFGPMAVQSDPSQGYIMPEVEGLPPPLDEMRNPPPAAPPAGGAQPSASASTPNPHPPAAAPPAGGAQPSASASTPNPHPPAATPPAGGAQPSASTPNPHPPAAAPPAGGAQPSGSASTPNPYPPAATSPAGGEQPSGSASTPNPHPPAATPPAGGTQPSASASTPNPHPPAAKPPAGGTQPSAGGAQPSAGGAQPSAGGAQPSAGGTQPSAGGAQPSAGGAQPSAGGAQPSAATPHQPIAWLQEIVPPEEILKVDELYDRKGYFNETAGAYKDSDLINDAVNWLRQVPGKEQSFQSILDRNQEGTFVATAQMIKAYKEMNKKYLEVSDNGTKPISRAQYASVVEAMLSHLDNDKAFIKDIKNHADDVEAFKREDLEQVRTVTNQMQTKLGV